MRLYKFRSLVTDEDFIRAKEIIETGCFWCSKFAELNDPMEGVFCTHFPQRIESVYNEKMKYKICSFSNIWAFKKPQMWGYYAGGFKGIAIEIELPRSDVHKVIYVNDIQVIEDRSIDGEVEKILSTKLKSWSHEGEYRFLKETDDNENSIGNITAIYFGNPHGNICNRNDIENDNNHLQDHRNYEEQLITIARNKSIACCHVNIEGTKVIKGQDID